MATASPPPLRDPSRIAVDVGARSPASRSALTMRAGSLPGSPAFRDEAVAAYLRGAEARSVLRVVSPSTWVLFGFLASIVTTAITGSFIGRIELTTTGHGVLRSPGGAQPVLVQTSGVVSEVHARSGSVVAKGAALVKIDSASTQAALLEADARVAMVTSTLERLKTREKSLYEERIAMLHRKVALLKRRATSQHASVARLEKKARSYGSLADRGYVGTLQRGDVDEELSQATRQEIATEEETTQALSEIAALDSQEEAEIYKWTAEADEARVKRDALKFALGQSVVSSPQAGIVETFLVRPGDTLQVGAPIARIVPDQTPLELIAFLPERDRAFVTEGAKVRVELEQLPVAEFGAFHAHIVRIGRDLASPTDVGDVLGAKSEIDGPTYRVELALDDDEQSRHYASMVRSGMIANVRYTLRKRRIIGLLIDPLKRWFY